MALADKKTAAPDVTQSAAALSFISDVVSSFADTPIPCRALPNRSLPKHVPAMRPLLSDR